MPWVMYLSTFCILFAANKVKRNQQKYLIAVAVAFMIILIAGNYTNLDYANYQESYSRVLSYSSHAKEWLYSFLKEISYSKLGLNYDIFRLLLTAAGCTIMTLAFSKHIKYLAPVLMLFLVFPFCYYSTIFRNFLGACLFFYATYFLKELNTRNAVLYGAFIVLASGIHYLFAVYFVFYLCYFMDKTKIQKRIITFAAIASFIIALLPSTLISVAQNGLRLLGDDNRAFYMQSVATHHGYILWWGFQFIFFGIAYYAYKTTRDLQIHSDNEFVQHQIQMVRVVYNMSMISFLFCALYRLQGDFSRLLLNQLPLLFLQYECTREVVRSTANTDAIKNVLRLKWFVIGFAILYFVEIFIVNGLWDAVFMEMMRHNWILELL